MAHPAPKIINYNFSYLIVSVRRPSHTCAFFFVFLCQCLSPDFFVSAMSIAVQSSVCPLCPVPCGSTHAHTEARRGWNTGVEGERKRRRRAGIDRGRDEARERGREKEREGDADVVLNILLNRNPNPSTSASIKVNRKCEAEG